MRFRLRKKEEEEEERGLKLKIRRRAEMASLLRNQQLDFSALFSCEWILKECLSLPCHRVANCHGSALAGRSLPFEVVGESTARSALAARVNGAQPDRQPWLSDGGTDASEMEK